eukprot:PhF_6_TR36047/c2_g1_i1/m.52290
MAESLTTLFHKHDKKLKQAKSLLTSRHHQNLETLSGEAAGFGVVAKTVQITKFPVTNTMSNTSSVINIVDTPVDIGYIDPTFVPWRNIQLSSEPTTPKLVPKYVTPKDRKHQPPGLQTMQPWPSASSHHEDPHHHDVGTCTTPLQSTTTIYGATTSSLIPPVADGPVYTFSRHVAVEDDEDDNNTWTPPPPPPQPLHEDNQYGVRMIYYDSLPDGSVYTHMTEYHTKIFLGQIPYTLEKPQLARVLSYLVGAHIPEQYILLMKNKETHTSYGAGFVFVSPHDAQTLLNCSFRVLLRDDHMFEEVDPGALLRLRTYEITDQKGPQPMRIERAKETADQRTARHRLPTPPPPPPPSLSLSLQFSAISAPPFQQPPPTSNHYPYGMMYYPASNFP